MNDLRNQAAAVAAKAFQELGKRYAELVRELAGPRETRDYLTFEARYDTLAIAGDAGRSVSMRDGHPDTAALAALLKPADRAKPVELRLAQELVATHRLMLPTQDETQLRSIVGNKIERIGPWPASKAVYGMRIDFNAASPHGSVVNIAITGRDTVNDLVGDLAACGIEVNLVTAPVPQGAPVELFRQSTRDEAALGRRMSRLYLTGIASLAAATTAAAIGLVLLSSDLAQLKDRMDGSQRASFEAGATGADTDLESAARTLLARKRAAPSPLLALKDISQALPDGAWLNALTIADGIVTLGGTARDTAALLPALQATGILSDVAFAGPITRADDVQAANFSITARLNEHAGDWP